MQKQTAGWQCQWWRERRSCRASLVRGITRETVQQFQRRAARRLSVLPIGDGALIHADSLTELFLGETEFCPKGLDVDCALHLSIMRNS